MRELPSVAVLTTLTVGCRLAAETAEEATLLLSVGILLIGMVLIAPLLRGHLFLHRVDVLAAALPGGLSAYLAGGGSTHDCLLRCCAATHRCFRGRSHYALPSP